MTATTSIYLKFESCSHVGYRGGFNFTSGGRGLTAVTSALQNFTVDKVQLQFQGGPTAVTSELHCRQSSTFTSGGGVQLQSLQSATVVTSNGNWIVGSIFQFPLWWVETECSGDVGHFPPFLNYLWQVEWKLLEIVYTISRESDVKRDCSQFRTSLQTKFNFTLGGGVQLQYLNCHITLKCWQFPLRLCFTMSTNKVQGQTLQYVGIYLPDHVFTHGQLYVAFSRVQDPSALAVYLK